MTRPSALRPLLLLLPLLAAGPALAQQDAAPAAGKAMGEDKGRFCIPLRSIDRTEILDDRTILVDVRGRKDGYAIHLTSRCPGLRFDGFSYETSINQLCRSDPLRTVGTPVPATCLIERIEPLDEAGLATLRAAKKSASAGR
ncbi:MAG TPA: DUF6491 family protein [Azospirillaceae bacterium]|nr:DUF6491 family protein [Azospirillaceae bacterium]